MKSCERSTEMNSKHKKCNNCACDKVVNNTWFLWIERKGILKTLDCVLYIIIISLLKRLLFQSLEKPHSFLCTKFSNKILKILFSQIFENKCQLCVKLFGSVIIRKQKEYVWNDAYTVVLSQLYHRTTTSQIIKNTYHSIKQFFR